QVDDWARPTDWVGCSSHIGGRKLSRPEIDHWKPVTGDCYVRHPKRIAHADGDPGRDGGGDPLAWPRDWSKHRDFLHPGHVDVAVFTGQGAGPAGHAGHRAGPRFLDVSNLGTSARSSGLIRRCVCLFVEPIQPVIDWSDGVRRWL